MEIYVDAGTKVEAILVMAAFSNYGEVKSRDDCRLWLVPHTIDLGEKFLDWLSDTDYEYKLV